MKNQYTKGFLTGVAVAFIATAIALLPYLKEIQKEKVIQSYIDKNYIETVDKSEIYNGMFDSLDEYSCYYTKEDFKELNDSTDGNYCGIGIVTSYSDDSNCPIIRQIYPDTPAKKAGLKVGDKILYVNKDSTRNLRDIGKLTEKMKGKEGTYVKVTVLSQGEKKTVKVKREKVSYASTEKKILNGVGYLKIYTFDEKASKEIKKAVQYFKDKNITKVILDIRNNQGGLIDSLVACLEEVVPKQLVLTTKTKDGKKTVYTMKKGTDVAFSYVLLVNGNTVSCAEIFASVMKNGKYATLVGTPTYGKGVAQSIIPLYDGSGIKLTTEKWYDNKGNSINKKGVYPDIRVSYRYKGEDEFNENLLEDTQILKALEILK